MEDLKLKTESRCCWRFPKYELKDWKLWFKLTYVLLLTAVILDLYIRPIVNNIGYVHQINTLITQNNWTSVADVLAYGQTNGLPWINSHGQLIYTLGFTSGIVDGLTSIQAMYNPFEEVVAQSSYFTTISNVMVTVWMFCALWNPQNEGKKGFLNTRWSIIATTYITITFLIYNLALRVVNGTPANVLDIVSNEFLHTIGPVAFVGYTLFGVKYEQDEAFNFKHLKTTWLISFVLLVTYGVYAVVRGVIKFYSGYSNDSSYPYFFTQVTNDNVLGIHGAIWFVIFVFIIAGLCIGLGALYRFLFMKITARRNR